MPEEAKTVATTEEVAEEKTSYTKEEFEAALQAETDRRVTQALKKQAEKLQKAEAAERLSKLDGAERDRELARQYKEEYEALRKEVTLEKNKNAASKILGDRGIDLSLVDLVVADEAEVMNERIQLLDRAFKKSVKAEVEKRLASKSPQPTLEVNKVYTSKDFATMTLAQLAELKQAQPELFEN